MTYIIEYDFGLVQDLGLELYLTDKYDPEISFLWEDSGVESNDFLSVSGIKIIKRPEVKGEYFDWLVKVVNKNKFSSMPDVLKHTNGTLVSESVKDVIEKKDPVGVQFWPASIVFESGKSSVHKKYYWMWTNLVVDRPLRVAIKAEGVRLRSRPAKEVASLMLNNDDIGSCLRKLPVWRDVTSKRVLFISDDIADELIKNGATGIVRLDRNGKEGRIVNHV